MANPRNIVRFDSINGEYATFHIDGTTITFNESQNGGSDVVGRAVTLVGHATVELADDGDPILGRLTLVESDGKCNVQTGGYMYLPGGAGATLTPMSRAVGDLGGNGGTERGFIRAAGTAAEAGATDARIIDASTTSAIAVRI